MIMKDLEKRYEIEKGIEKGIQKELADLKEQKEEIERMMRVKEYALMVQQKTLLSIINDLKESE